MTPTAVSPHVSGQSAKMQPVTVRAVPCSAVGTVSAKLHFRYGPK
jgi:hypothetical protein